MTKHETVSTIEKFNFPKAVGPYVIIEARARSAGYEVKSNAGIIIESAARHGEIPMVGKIVSVGDECDQSLVGKMVLLPNGKMNYLPHPDELNGLRKREEVEMKLTVTHKANIAAIYDVE